MFSTKLEILELYHILRRTDERHPLTAAQLVDKLQLFGYPVERRTIYRDVALLQDAGYPVCLHENRNLGYYWYAPPFEDYEIKLLGDMVAASPFLTKKDSYRLTQRLCEIASPTGEKLLKSMLCMDESFKSENVQTKLVLDRLMTAIKTQKRFSFYYYDVSKGEKVLRKRKEKGRETENRRYTVSPYYLVYKGSDYYLLCVTKNHNALTAFRIDRMTMPEISAEAAQARSDVPLLREGFRLQDYVRSLSAMYAGPVTSIRLRCTPEVIGALKREFGKGIPLRELEDGFLQVDVKAAYSDGLCRWLMGHSDEVTVLEPAWIREKIKTRMEDALGRLTL